MPWCTDCDRFLSPSTVRPDGTCPTCGHTVDRGAAVTTTAVEESEDEQLPPIPWHLKLLALAVFVYLAFRLYQGIEWLTG